jgi:hypothetical protein
VFLETFDYGYITGNHVDLRIAIILMTCNIGLEPKIRVKIVRTHLAEFAKRSGEVLEMTEDAVDFIVRSGFSAKCGARRLALASIKQTDGGSETGGVLIAIKEGIVTGAA